VVGLQHQLRTIMGEGRTADVADLGQAQPPARPVAPRQGGGALDIAEIAELERGLDSLADVGQQVLEKLPMRLPASLGHRPEQGRRTGSPPLRGTGDTTDDITFAQRANKVQHRVFDAEVRQRSDRPVRSGSWPLAAELPRPVNPGALTDGNKDVHRVRWLIQQIVQVTGNLGPESGAVASDQQP
jgi:hypothetical protein